MRGVGEKSFPSPNGIISHELLLAPERDEVTVPRLTLPLRRIFLERRTMPSKKKSARNLTQGCGAQENCSPKAEKGN